MLNKICRQCDKEFSIYPSAVKKGEGKHCSKLCYTLSLRGKPRFYRRKRTILKCAICKKVFEINTCSLKHESRLHCSKKCYGISKVGEKMPSEFGEKIRIAKYGKKNTKIAGPNHYMWKGGITPLKRAIRSSFEYDQWHAKIMARDYYTCQICKTKKGPFNVDHYPVQFSEILKNNKIETLEQALSCSDFWDLTKGRTLCVPCHKQIPIKFK